MFAAALRFLFFFFNDTATTEIYTLSLHDALPISDLQHIIDAPHDPEITVRIAMRAVARHVQAVVELLPVPGHVALVVAPDRSEEHTSELPSPCNIVCRLLL